MEIRTFVVSREEAGRAVVAFLKVHLRLSWGQARRLVERNRVRQGPRLCRDPQSRVRAGQKIRIQLDDKASVTSDAVEPRRRQVGPRHAKPTSHHSTAKVSGPQPALVHVDDQIVVVNKLAGLTTMRHAHEAAEFGRRGQRFLPATLADMLPELLASRGKGPGRVIAVHRLDRDTSGLVIFARNPTAAKHLGEQFRRHSADRTYLALVRGRATTERIESLMIPDRGDSRRGSAASDASVRGGQRAITHVNVIEHLGEFTFIECHLETGRTHQVRIHLGERGTPICGERVYDRPLHGAPLPDTSGAERLMLHAATLAVEHPSTGKKMHWTATMPADMTRLLGHLRRGKS